MYTACIHKNNVYQKLFFFLMKSTAFFTYNVTLAYARYGSSKK